MTSSSIAGGRDVATSRLGGPIHLDVRGIEAFRANYSLNHSHLGGTDSVLRTLDEKMVEGGAEWAK